MKEEDEDGEAEIIVNPECPLTGHSDVVNWVAFSGDGAQVVSASENDHSVRVWDVASGKQIRYFAGDNFALVEGLFGEHQRNRHIITINRDRFTLRIYEVGTEQQDAEGGAAAAPVACFKAPHQVMFSVRCRGSTICAGCGGGAVCILSAPFLIA